MADLIARLEAATADMESAQADLNAASLRASEELQALQDLVIAVSAPGLADVEARPKRLRRAPCVGAPSCTMRAPCVHHAWCTTPASGTTAAAAASVHERPFAGVATDAEERLQSVRCTMAKVDGEVRQARASVEAAKASAAPLLPDARVIAAVREARNEACSALLQLPTTVQLVVMSSLSVVQLWRARGVSRHCSRRATEVLEMLPQLLSVGGSRVITPLGGDDEELEGVAGLEVETMSLATMRWDVPRVGVGPPVLLTPRAYHVLAAFRDGRVVAAGGFNPRTYAEHHAGGNPMMQLLQQAVQWVPGSAAWSALPNMSVGRSGAAAVVLSNGQLLVAGGLQLGDPGDQQETEDGGMVHHASAEVLAADGSGWEAVAPMSGPRVSAVAGLLPNGIVVVAGGQSTDVFTSATRTVEQWDPVANKWSALPSMVAARSGAAGCVLADGRFVMVGGRDASGHMRSDSEFFDLRCGVAGTWELLADERLQDGISHMAVARSMHAVVAVAGGIIAIGGDEEGAAVELYDEESSRWLSLRHRLNVLRDDVARVVSAQ